MENSGKITVDEFDPILVQAKEHLLKMPEVKRQTMIKNLIDRPDYLRTFLSEKSPADLIRLIHSRVSSLLELGLSDMDLGRVHLIKGNVTEAKRYFHQAGFTESQTENHNPLNLIYFETLVAIEEKNIYRSSANIAQLLKLDLVPESVPYLNYLQGRFHKLLRCYFEAANFFLASIEGGQTEGFYDLGDIYLGLGKFQEAGRVFYSGILEKDVRSYYGMGLALEGLREYGAAAVFFNLVRKYNVKEAWPKMMKCRAKSGQKYTLVSDDE